MRGSLIRFLRVLSPALAGALVVIGGVALPPAGLVAVGLVAATVACLAAGGLRDCRPGGRSRSAADAAVVAGGGSVIVALGFAGLVVVLGGPVAVLLAAGALVVWLGVLRFRRASARSRRRTTSRTTSSQAPARSAEAPRPALPAPERRPLHPLVTDLSTAALGREWLLSSSALGVSLDAGARQAIVRRRQELLDELERRDPAGFARWIAAGPQPGSDPADFLRGGADAEKDAA